MKSENENPNDDNLNAKRPYKFQKRAFDLEEAIKLVLRDLELDRPATANLGKLSMEIRGIIDRFAASIPGLGDVTPDEIQAELTRALESLSYKFRGPTFEEVYLMVEDEFPSPDKDYKDLIRSFITKTAEHLGGLQSRIRRPSAAEWRAALPKAFSGAWTHTLNVNRIANGKRIFTWLNECHDANGEKLAKHNPFMEMRKFTKTELEKLRGVEKSGDQGDNPDVRRNDVFTFDQLLALLAVAYKHDRELFVAYIMSLALILRRNELLKRNPQTGLPYNCFENVNWDHTKSIKYFCKSCLNRKTGERVYVQKRSVEILLSYRHWESLMPKSGAFWTHDTNDFQRRQKACAEMAGLDKWNGPKLRRTAKSIAVAIRELPRKKLDQLAGHSEEVGKLCYEEGLTIEDALAMAKINEERILCWLEDHVLVNGVYEPKLEAAA